jgi:hypothetical protein
MIPTFLIEKFGPTGAKVAFFGGIVLLLAIIVGGFAIYERHVGATGEVVKEQGRTIDTLNKVGDANANASAARVEDTLKGETQKTEITNAERAATSPDDLRRRRGCVILRQQGRSAAASAAGC